VSGASPPSDGLRADRTELDYPSARRTAAAECGGRARATRAQRVAAAHQPLELTLSGALPSAGTIIRVDYSK